MAYFIRFQTGFKFNIDKYLITLIINQSIVTIVTINYRYYNYNYRYKKMLLHQKKQLQDV
jgi:hypothetical protein